MEAYDAERFEPPAPLAMVAIRLDRNGQVIQKVPMLIDTGADISLLPRSYVESVISPDADQFELEGFDGSVSRSPVVAVELLFLDKSFKGEFLVVDGWHGILGRNILNNLSIVLDGPMRQWREQR